MSAADNVGQFIDEQMHRITDTGLERGKARTFVLGAMMVASYGHIGLARAAVERAVEDFISLKPSRSRVVN